MSMEDGMVTLDFMFLWVIFVSGFVYLLFTHPIVIGCIAAFYAVLFIWVYIYERWKRAKKVRVALEVEKKYSEMSEPQRQRIVSAVMEGADIDEFSLEDGLLKRGNGEKARYAKTTWSWGIKQNHLDLHPLYAKENEILKKDFSKFNLSDAETYALSSLMYFNWVVIGMDESPDELLVSMTRRGEHAFKRYSRSQFVQASEPA